MRIFHAVSPIPEASLTQSQIWSYNLKLPLLDLGHELVLFRWDYADKTNFLDPADPSHQESINRSRARLSEES